MKLLIAIPALNEEKSIADTVSRTLDARKEIVASTPVTDVEVTVVSDGSTDGTVEQARSFGGASAIECWRPNRNSRSC